MASSEESRDQEWIKFKGRSKVWEYFLVNKDKSKVKCSLCENTYTYCSATTQLSQHLKKEHKIDKDGDKTEEPASSGGSTRQLSIYTSMAKAGRDSLCKVCARMAAKDRFSYRQIAESLDIRDG